MSISQSATGSRRLMLGYVRVSTEEQAESRAGLDAQEAAIRAEAERRGWDLRLFSDEGRSGKHINPALSEALELLADGRADGLVVAKMDRLARSVIHAAEISAQSRRFGWALVALDMNLDTTTPAGKAMMQMLAVFAEFERDLISERTRAALAAKKAQGVRIGAPERMSRDAKTKIIELRADGLSFAKIAAALEADGVLSPSGSMQWQPSTVRRAFARMEA